MIHVKLPSTDPRRLPFFLALEEWTARALPAADYFFTWTVNDTVICGRNQDIAAEVNLDYCRARGIDVVRRKSGGGCVFADRHNIMTSFVTVATDVQSTFAKYIGLLAAQLRAMGIQAEVSGRNDILVGDRKVSGSAFYHLPGRSIVHGTMLYDTDMDKMLNAITPSRAKLQSHKVTSVAGRITTVRALRPEMTMDAFHAALIRGLADKEYTLTPAQVHEVEHMEQDYYKPDWLDI